MQETRNNKLKYLIKSFLYKTVIYDKLYLGFLQKYIRPQTVKNDEILDICIQNIKDSSIFHSSGINLKKVQSCKGIEVATLATYVADIKVMDNLKNKTDRGNVF